SRGLGRSESVMKKSHFAVGFLAVVMSLASSAARAQTYEVLRGFETPQFPYGTLLRDAGGNLYGTTIGGGDAYGGAWSAGTVFKLSPDGTVTFLHDFSTGDGAWAVLALDGSGNLYGTTSGGGADFGAGFGTVFKLAPDGAYTVLHSFDGSDGAYPEGGLVLDGSANLYGTTSHGGRYIPSGYGDGTVFKIGLDGTYTVLHRFAYSDGANPEASLLLDGNGN